MSIVRRLLLAAGVVVFAVGFADAFLLGGLGLPLQELFLFGVGLVALVLALGLLAIGARADIEEADPPEAESFRPMALPGDDLDEILTQFTGEHSYRNERTRIRDGLRAAAIAVLTRYHGIDAETARGRVERGEWTDDPYAASFLGHVAPPERPLSERLRARLRGGDAFYRNLRRAVDAIAERAGLPPSDRRIDGGDDEGRAPGTDAFGADPTARVFPALDHAAERLTGHWDGVRAVTLLCVGVGVITRRPAILLAGVVGIGFAAYARSADAPEGVPLSVERELDDPDPLPGDDVEVTVTVRNESDRPLPDLRLVDGVPDGLTVAEGSPRFGTALRGGEAATFTYTVAAHRGEHEFGPLFVAARDWTGGGERERVVPGGTTLRCVPPLRATVAPVPLRQTTTSYTGQVATDIAGEGIEFYAVREYRPGDPLNRIDWNRRARTGEFATLQFREERAANVVVLIDARVEAYVSPEPDVPPAVDRAVDAAGRIFAKLTDEGNYVGIAALSAEDCWLAPGVGSDHRIRARELLATHPALAPVPEAEQFMPVAWERRFRGRLTGPTQIVLLSPLCDEYGAIVARRLETFGYPVTVVSPDPTADWTPSHGLARISRALRVTDLREHGIPVVDWEWDESIDMAMARHHTGGSE